MSENCISNAVFNLNKHNLGKCLLYSTETYSLFTPGTTDGDDFFTVEELLLKTLQKQGEVHSSSLYKQ